MIGTKLAHYEIISHLGTGGMGEVYQATDSKLGRSVAIKFLPEAFSHDSERVARFDREARVLALLNHSNIAAIHGLEESGGRRFLVMELVGGETLAERIKRGPIQVGESLQIAKQICEALESAHEKGVIHRDLKPANVKITPEGEVKVLDFGLAKALESQPEPSNLSNSPTMMSASMPGVILGTASYMSPEQARGRTVDKRTDIFAFVSILYEMLTGRLAFAGEDMAEILGRIMTTEADWSLLPAETPAAIHRLLRRGFQKDVRKRLADIRDARHEIEDALAEPPAAVREKTSRRALLYRSIAALLIVVLAIVAVRHLSEVPVPQASEIHLELTTPPTRDPTSLAVSHDGKRILFVSTYEGRSALWLRSLDSDVSRPLPGTAGATFPFWSADDRSIGFFADSLLKRIDLDGGAPQTLATASMALSPGTWNKDGVILFTPVPGRPLLRLSGSESTVATQIAPSQESGHDYPLFLPDGRHFLFNVAVGGSLYAGELGRTDARRLLEGAQQSAYARGHLLFVRGDTLFAQEFDPDRIELKGSPLPVAENLLLWPTAVGPAVAVSEAGTIAYRSASGNPHSQFVWFDRTGNKIGEIGNAPDPAFKISAPAMSPDGSRIALFRVWSDNIDVWLLELARGVLTRFTSNPANDVMPIWSPDGARLVFSSTRNAGVHDLYMKLSNSAPEEQLILATAEDKFATDWSPDSSHILYYTYAAKTQNDIWALRLNDRKPFAVVQTAFEERNAQFSPDGHWIAYQSNESGRFEVYIQPFPGPGARTRISTDGGAQARWRRDGKELFYIALDGRLMAIPLRLPAAGQNVQVQAPVPLLTTHMPLVPEHLDGQQYMVSADGQRFLINTLAEEATSPIKLILNWTPPQK